VRGDLLDIVLLVAAAAFALSGYRQGLVVGALSFAGFLGGGVLGARLAPRLVLGGPFAGLDPTLVGLAAVLVLAFAGQLLASFVGSRLRRALTWRPARLVDAIAGGLVSVVSLLLVAWLIAAAVASAPYPALASQVRRSVVIAAVDTALPAQARTYFDGFRRLIKDHGFPDVFGGLDPTRSTDVGHGGPQRGLQGHGERAIVLPEDRGDRLRVRA
jgi:uncharacterized membrane protein required for colicin V production